MEQNHKLMGSKVGGWWEPVRSAVWNFAGVKTGVGSVAQLDGKDVNELALPMPEKLVITYISRQGAPRRKLLQDDHTALVTALQELVARKGKSWELHVLHAERMSKDEQIQAVAKTTVSWIVLYLDIPLMLGTQIMLGVHGNGLSHLLFMKPSRVSAVIEMFYPGGFAHDYHWTSRALGMDHYAVWNNTYLFRFVAFSYETLMVYCVRYYTYPNEPGVDYPEGFQGNSIPVDGPAVARLIEEHVDRKTKT